MKQISVVIPTVDRPHLLRRAITSIENQDYSGPIEIVIVICSPASSQLRAVEEVIRTARIKCVLCVLSLDETIVADNPLLNIYPPARVARMRNAGVAAAQGDFVAHLDDDNEYLPSHLSSLVAVLDSAPELPAAYSWRYILWEDGSPFTDNMYPWIKQPKPAYAQYIFDDLVRYDVFRPNSCEMRDQYITPAGEHLLTVDSSEWLIRRSFNLQFPFLERLQFRQVSHALSDDYLFCKQLADAQITVGCSAKCTVNYYLGGRSSQWLKEIH